MLNEIYNNTPETDKKNVEVTYGSEERSLLSTRVFMEIILRLMR